MLDALTDPSTGKAVRLALLEALSEGDVGDDSDAFEDALRVNLASEDDVVVRQTLLAASALGSKRLAEPLLAIGLDQQRADALARAGVAPGFSVGPTGFRAGL